jgi:NADP-dependent 3-hydroxy acid dehydrogenase YdfG
VALVGRDAAALDGVAKEIGGRSYPADFTDLTDRETLRGLIERVEADGPLDVLVNNAGDDRIAPHDRHTRASLYALAAHTRKRRDTVRARIEKRCATCVLGPLLCSPH